MAYFECPSYDSTVLSLPTPSEASGSIARFNTDLTENLLSAVAEFSASQASGTPTPAAPIPIVGVDKVNVTRCGKNLLGGSKLLANAQAYLPSGTTDLVNKTFKFSSTASTTSGLFFSSGLPFKENTQYTFILTASKTSGTSFNMRVGYTDGTYDNIMGTGTDKNTVILVSDANKTVRSLYKYNGTGTTTLYYEECGVFEGDLSETDFEPYNGTTALINLGDTYYGGTVDAITGKITLDHKKFTFDGSENWSATDTHIFRLVTTPNNWLPVNAENWQKVFYSNILRTDVRATGASLAKLPDHCFYITTQYLYVRLDEYELADFKTALGSTNLQIVAPVSTPEIVYASNTAEIPTIVGDNQVFADTGDVVVKYFETIKSALY